MKTILSALAGLALTAALFASDQVLIVADEFPAMEHVAARLKAEENVTSRVVWQTNLPPELSGFSAVMVYIHKALSEPAEKAFIAYALAGGKLIVLHHSISAVKRNNKEWFKVLGVALPEGDVGAGGYKWIEGVTQRVVNLAPGHFITTHKIRYLEEIGFRPGGAAAETPLPGFTLTNSEVYLNHILDGPRTLLLGFKFTDDKSGKTYEQSHSGWLKPSGKGWIIFLQPGHSLRDLEHPVFDRILLNALVWKP